MELPKLRSILHKKNKKQKNAYLNLAVGREKSSQWKTNLEKKLKSQ